VVEAPAIISRDGTWYLFYSGGIFDQTYAINYASCASLTQLCSRAFDDPWLFDGWEGLTNPGGQDMLQLSSDAAFMFYHRDVSDGSRRMVMSIVEWSQ
jgi:arabinan endo-1,5-alpha-L-arabinosidase